MRKISKEAEILTPGKGSIAKEYRPAQIKMAELVSKAILTDTNLLVEAGVGTGKSFGYLIPAILSGKRTVISTATIGLQTQLIKKDLPVLHEYFAENGTQFSYAVAKGKNNYLCPNAVESAIDNGSIPISDVVARWAEDVKQGNVSGDRFDGPDMKWNHWELVNGESCVGSKCPHAATCASLTARYAVDSAKIVVANHAITAVQVAYRSDNYAGVLGDHDVLIIDEAHKAVNFFRSMFTTTSNDTSASKVSRKLLEINVPKIDGNIMHGWELCARKFFKALPDPSSKGFTFIDPSKASTPLVSSASDLLGYTEVYKPLSAFTTTVEKEVTENGNTGYYAIYTLLKRARGVIDSILTCAKEATLANVTDDEQKVSHNVVYVQKSMSGRKEIHAAPLDVGGILSEKLYPNVRSVILTSATLSVGGSFKAAAKEFAMPPDNTESAMLGNVFDYDTQAVLYIPKGLAEPKFGNNKPFISDISNEIVNLVKLTHGNTLVLFTSSYDLADTKKECLRRLEGCVPNLRVLCQSPDLKAPDILAEYVTRHEKGLSSVIFGLKSFWEGVSLEGDLLTSVIITKIPFPPMSDPVYAAKCESSDNSFMDVTIPEMVKDIKQGTGRLIRTKDDFGVVSILDGRIHTKRYGTTVLKSLPFGSRTTSFDRLVGWYAKKRSK